jgi:hypothetical protein
MEVTGTRAAEEGKVHKAVNFPVGKPLQVDKFSIIASSTSHTINFRYSSMGRMVRRRVIFSKPSTQSWSEPVLVSHHSLPFCNQSCIAIGKVKRNA